MCPQLLILNGLAMQHELQRKTLRSFLPFTGPVDKEEAVRNDTICPNRQWMRRVLRWRVYDMVSTEED